jgi:hypothetical protein
MAEDNKNKVEQELAEIKVLLKKMQRKAEIQWVYTLGFAAMIGSVALLSTKASPWGALAVFLAGLVLMMLAPYIK